jgi:hypothetical protein
MTASELKYKVEQAGTCEHFFTRNTMRFFGDTMKNYGVRSATVATYTEPAVETWELYRRHAVKHGLKTSTYFSKADFERVHPKNNPHTVPVIPGGKAMQ